MVMRAVVFQPMANVPAPWLPRLRELSYGPYDGSMHRWSYHDGSTWCSVLFEATELSWRHIVGWCVFTLQEEDDPVIGVYVDPDRRGRGYATELVRYTLQACHQYVSTGAVYATSSYWPKYPQLIRSFGWRHKEWE